MKSRNDSSSRNDWNDDGIERSTLLLKASRFILWISREDPYYSSRNACCHSSNHRFHSWIRPRFMRRIRGFVAEDTWFSLVRVVEWSSGQFVISDWLNIWLFEQVLHPVLCIDFCENFINRWKIWKHFIYRWRGLVYVDNRYEYLIWEILYFTNNNVKTMILYPFSRMQMIELKFSY